MNTIREKVNICFTTDNNYVRPLSCAITSILKNSSPETDLRIFILEQDVSYENKSKIFWEKNVPAIVEGQKLSYII